MSTLFVVGIGPGGLNHMTFEAREAIERADVVVGYQTYLEFIESLLEGKEVISSGMTREVERCRRALESAALGKTVALVSSGDAGIYGMAGLVMELAENVEDQDAAPEIIVVPGVSALQSAAAVLGAPLMHDFAVISLSDLLTPWDLIERRLALAAAGDFVIALYNPRSKGRVRHLEEAREILLASRAATTPVGIVRHACREGEEKKVTTLGEMLTCPVDMFSLVIVGNSSTYVDEAGRMVTPRGYETGTGDRGPGIGKIARQMSVGRDTGCQSEGSELLDSAFHRSPVPGPRSLMFCGTGSDVGKSVLTAGFCRILSNRGIGVVPFKSQNMALNSAVTPEGGEIGRAQAVQAEACRIPPHVDMNPVLLKPNSDTGSQVIVHGVPVGNMSVREYNSFKPEAFGKIRESFRRLRERSDFIVIEGAGSIAEINLKAHDIANMKVAEMAGCPVILVADIDRGGVFAQIVGTIELLEPEERRRVQGVVINKFRGDPSLLRSGIEFVEKRTGVPVLGVVPWFSGFRIPDEDSVPLQKKRAAGTAEGKLAVGVVRFPRISNYTDFDPLEYEPDVHLSYLERPEQVTGLDMLILPGTKSTIADLTFLEESGLAEAVKGFPGPVVGICGGYQMLGRRVLDPDGVESARAEAVGLGLLDVETVMQPVKATHQVTAQLLEGGGKVAPGLAGELSGYEIHMGETTLAPSVEPFASITTRSGRAVTMQDGAVSPDGRVVGTYLHGIFGNTGFRSAFLNQLRLNRGLPLPAPAESEDPFDQLARHLEQNLDMPRLFAICGLPELAGEKQ